jgi:pyrimidine operon attenuation protein/uracil phosphoribosyltransferase
MLLPDAESLIAKLAEQIRRDAGPPVALIGIYTGGVWMAERLHRVLGLATPMGTIDVAFYRDDFKKTGLRAGVRPSDIPFQVEDAHIILVDDVLYTGRTIRAALNEVFDYGRPASIRLAALVDRGGRQLPIYPHFVGAVMQIPPDQTIELRRDQSGRFTLALIACST